MLNQLGRVVEWETNKAALRLEQGGYICHSESHHDKNRYEIIPNSKLHGRLDFRDIIRS